MVIEDRDPRGLLHDRDMREGTAARCAAIAPNWDTTAESQRVIFSMEGVFAAFAGWLVLAETLTGRALFGCALMLAGLIVCQASPGRKRSRQQRVRQAS
jgi:drug/metabolite transporter (DMT)-like permease